MGKMGAVGRSRVRVAGCVKGFGALCLQDVGVLSATSSESGL